MVSADQLFFSPNLRALSTRPVCPFPIAPSLDFLKQVKALVLQVLSAADKYQPRNLSLVRVNAF